MQHKSSQHFKSRKLIQQRIIDLYRFNQMNMVYIIRKNNELHECVPSLDT